ncbi:hypothetical protein [Tautonia rosea]|uniref:hypothetical protein n=1 Tax=Tautonia rosea TaxID=2728037 RepID=UPI001475FF75|nr:hypothetical protein [Tautonia rosea]
MIARLLLPGLVAMLLAPGLAGAQDPFGTYSYVRGQRGDQKIAEAELKDNTVKIEDGKLSLIGADGTVQFEIRYVIDDEPEEGTYKATMEIVKSTIMEDAVGAKAKALGKAEGTEILLIYEFGGTDYPESFEPKSPSQHLFVLKKVPAGTQ